jgi:hypothetical protein
MRVASGPFPHFELISEYEVPLLNLQFDDFKAIYSQKSIPQSHSSPQKYPEGTLKVLHELTGNW